MVDSGIMSRLTVVPRTFLVAGVLCSMLAGGAAANVPGLADRWEDTQAAHPGLGKVLVVGLVHDPKARRGFEDRFVTLLRARGTEAITGYSIVPDLQAERNPAVVLKALFDRQVEAVITVRLKPVDKTTEETWAAGWREEMARPERARDYVDAALRGFDPEAKELGAEVVLWSLEESRRVWAGRFPRQKLKFLRKHAGEMSQAAIDEMRFVGLF
jgi:hypothetical protein